MVISPSFYPVLIYYFILGIIVLIISLLKHRTNNKVNDR